MTTIHKRERTLNNKVCLILLAISAALAVATLFVPVIYNVTLPYIEGGSENPKTSIGFYYYFVQGWKNIVELSKLGRSNESTTLVAIQLVIMIISFLIAAILITYTIVVALKNEFKDDKPANIKRSFTLISAGILQYFFIINLINGIKIINPTSTTDESSHFFVGTYLMIASFAFGLISSIIDEYKNKDRFKRPENILVLNSSIVILMLILFGSNKIYMTERDSVTSSSTIFYFFTFNRERMMSDNFKTMSLIAMIASFVAIIFLFLSYYKFLNLRKDKKEKSLIVYITFYLVSSLLYILLTYIALKDYLEEMGEEIVKFGTGAYITFVFSSLLLISAIITYLFKNNIIKYKENKVEAK